VRREFASGLELGVTLEAGAVAGLLGGALMAGWAIIAALISGQGAVAPFALFGATFVGVEALLRGPEAVVLGVVLHVCTSVFFGVVFAAIVGRESAQSFAAYAGVLFGIAVLLFMTFVITPVIDPVLRERVPMMRGAWVIQHVLYGLGVAWVPWLRRRITERGHRARLAAFHREHARSAPPPARPPL
jgi:uncharacterized membrane protein YagU involved in acid resistance